jgi:hypothetical protein
MKAICVRQPWAWLLFHGKPVENRTWFTAYRGPLVIIASKEMSDAEWVAARLFVAGFDAKLADCIPPRHLLTFGAALGSVHQIGCVKRHESPFFCGPFGHVYAIPQLFPEPVPVSRGQLGIFNWRVEDEPRTALASGKCGGLLEGLEA